MDIRIAPNKIERTQEQILTIDDKIITLVGENGSGKSAILERVFKDYLDQNDVTLVSFTSGQNESFSKIFFDHLVRSRKFLIENSVDADPETEEERMAFEKQRKLNSFYFDIKWAPVLIFFATALKHDGETRKFLRGKGLLTEMPLPVGADRNAYRLDISTKLWFQFRILSAYTKKLEQSDRAESLDSSKKSIRKSIVHRLLEKLATHYDNNYDFTGTFYTKGKYLSASNVFRVLGRDVAEIFTFLGHALKNNQFIINHNLTLYFKDGIQLNDLSDGEFQLLTVYAIIDLFDGTETLFLFDEIDSHVHYKNTQKLWSFLKTINGNLLTTTHSADSIILHKPKNLRLVRNGLIEDEQTAEHIFYRLESLTENATYKQKVAAQFDYIVLVENRLDWLLFIELAKRKVPNYDPRIEAIYYIKCSSGYNNAAQNFADTRKKWVTDFKNINGLNSSTKAVFFLCDRDNLPSANINADGVSLNGIGEVPAFKQNIKPFPLVWRRREIENYLISPTLLQAVGKFDEFIDTFHVNLRRGTTMDIDPIRILDVKRFINPLYLKEGYDAMDNAEKGVDYEKLRHLIAQIPPEEISEDIENMYNFILSKMD